MKIQYFTQKQYEKSNDSLFSQRLQAARRAKGIKASVLSELAGCDRNAVADYEKALRCPNARAIRNLALVLDVSSDYLLGIEKEAI